MVEVALVNKLLLAVLPSQDEEPIDSQVEFNERDDRNDDRTYGDNSVVAVTGYSEHRLDAGDVQRIHELYEGIQDKSVPFHDIAESMELIKLKEYLLEYKAFPAEKSQTAKLWLQYIE